MRFISRKKSNLTHTQLYIELAHNYTKSRNL
jgi:hypothetical protein